MQAKGEQCLVILMKEEDTEDRFQKMKGKKCISPFVILIRLIQQKNIQL